jgi:hypothetical protein
MPIELEPLEPWQWLVARRDLFGEEDYKKSDKWERYVARQIRYLSRGNLQVEFTGFGAGLPKKIDYRTYNPEQKLDLTIKFKGKPIAMVEVQADYTRNYAESRIFQIFAHKIQLGEKSRLPTFFVYILTKEKTRKCFWLSMKDIVKHGSSGTILSYRGEQFLVNVYRTPKGEWHRGLTSLVSNLSELATP